MRAMKGAIPLANWLMRFSLITFIFALFFDVIDTWNFSDLNYLISFGFVAASVLLIIGGFFASNSLTVLSGILIFLLSVGIIVFNYIDTGSFAKSILIYLMPAAIGFYFFARGNNG
jgi:hypothetical protein